jgi:hypothetical protein
MIPPCQACLLTRPAQIRIQQIRVVQQRPPMPRSPERAAEPAGPIFASRSHQVLPSPGDRTALTNAARFSQLGSLCG